jgi:molybdate transport system substrate-binding protein
MRRLFLPLLTALSLLAAPAVQAAELTVFAAASLTDAIKAVNDKWVAAGNAPISSSFAASSALARQIEQGAPADLFLSADEPWMDYVQKAGLIVDTSRKSVLGNALVLIAPATAKTANIKIDKTTDLLALLGKDGRIATGDPASVPVGKYAQQSLTSLGMWDKLQPRIASAENVRAALLLVERGEVPLGIVYATDAAASKAVKVVGTFPADSHPAITYPFAVTKRAEANADAKKLLQFLSGPEATAIFRAAGFTVQ